MAQAETDSKSVIADLVLEKVNCPASHRQEFKLCIEKSLKSHSERLIDMLSDHLEAHRTPDEISAKMSHMDDYLTACFRQRNIELLSEETVNQDQDGWNNCDAHVEAIQKYAHVLTKDLRVEGTLVLDNLVQNEVLSEAGRQSIIQRGKVHSINSAFLKFCNGLSLSKFNKAVLPALENSKDSINAELAKELAKEITVISTKERKRSPCASCRIRNTVNYRRLADQLYEMKAISDNFREDLSSQNISNDSKWKLLLCLEKREALVFALKKYCDVYKWMRLTSQTITTCLCSMDTESEEDMEMDVASDVARLSDVSSMTVSTYRSPFGNASRNSDSTWNSFQFLHKHIQRGMSHFLLRAGAPLNQFEKLAPMSTVKMEKSVPPKCICKACDLRFKLRQAERLRRKRSGVPPSVVKRP